MKTGRKGRLLQVTAVAGAATLLLPMTTTSATASTKSLSVVLIGDSYSAGNGAGAYFGPSGSYRSSNNWAQRYVDWLNAKGIHTTLQNEAFSGYTSKQVLDEEIGNVPSNADVVMMTIGGNDVHFEKIVEQCFAVGWRDAKGCREKVEYAKDHLDDVVKSTKQVFSALQSRLASDAQVVLVGYPLLSMDKDYVLQNCTAHVRGICIRRVQYDAAAEVRRLGQRAVTEQRRMVSEWNSANKLKVTYVPNTPDAFAGHEPDPSATNKNDYRWINEFLETEGRVAKGGKTTSKLSNDKNNFYHPNLIGHTEIAQLLREKVGIPSSVRTVTPTAGNIDIAFVIDTTGSMGDDIDAVRDNVRSIVDQVEASSASARYGLVTYRDFPEETGDDTDYPSRVDLPFTANATALKGALDGLTVNGGGDWAESVYSGVMASVGLKWRNGVRKVTIVLGDAPPKDPEPISGYTPASVARAAYEVDPVEVYGVDTADLANGDSFEQLVNESGGKIYSPGDVEDIPSAVVKAITRTLRKPFAWVQGPYVGKVGDTLDLDASGSYAVTGRLVKFEWDFDGDGEYDASTTSPTTNHTFNREMTGVLGLRVTDSSGVTGVATTPIQITDDGDGTPRSRDNCPNVANHGQTDYDEDGVGDECDSTPGYPTRDKEGVSEVRSGSPDGSGVRGPRIETS